MSLTLASENPPAARRTLVVTWAKAIGGLAVAKIVSFVEPTGLLAGNLAGVAAFLFIALPDRILRDRGEFWAELGLPWWGLRDVRTWKAWGRGAALGLGACAVIFPVFFFGYRGFVELLPHLPPWAEHALAPYVGTPSFRWRLPEHGSWRFWVNAVNQFLVVALPEELFYRGWMQTTWKRSDPSRGVKVLGARLGAGFLWTQVLFASGHLVVLAPWRLGTFFPGLLFGWLRERTGDISTGVTVHAASNIFMQILEASFYG